MYTLHMYVYIYVLIYCLYKVIGKYNIVIIYILLLLIVLHFTARIVERRRLCLYSKTDLIKSFP